MRYSVSNVKMQKIVHVELLRTLVINPLVSTSDRIFHHSVWHIRMDDIVKSFVFYLFDGLRQSSLFDDDKQIWCEHILTTCNVLDHVLSYEIV